MPEPSYMPVWHPSIVADLAELLTQSDAQWYEVEELLLYHAPETRFIHLLRSTQSRSFFFGQASGLSFVVDEDARQILMHRLLPYATLLDTRLTPLEQAQQIHQAGIPVEAFCLWALQTFPEYRAASELALSAWLDYGSLLRGAERTPEPHDHLLRSASDAQWESDELLRAGSQLEPASEPLKRGLWQRMWRKCRLFGK